MYGNCDAHVATLKFPRHTDVLIRHLFVIIDHQVDFTDRGSVAGGDGFAPYSPCRNR
jgi:hypothetical protein